MDCRPVVQRNVVFILMIWIFRNDVLKEGVERKGVVDLVAGTMQALTSFQDAARKYKELARRTINLNGSGDLQSFVECISFVRIVH